MNIILSIRPKYCESIKSEEKKYEFRRRIFSSHQDIGVVYMYATSPVKKIVGWFTVEQVIHDRIKSLWNSCKKEAGISKKEFFDYFDRNEMGYALKIGEVTNIDPIDPRGVIPKFAPPQSFCYVGDSFKTLLELVNEELVLI